MYQNAKKKRKRLRQVYCISLKACTFDFHMLVVRKGLLPDWVDHECIF